MPQANHGDLIEAITKRVVPEEARNRLRMLAGEMDQLFFVDDSHELAVDRRALIRVVNNEALVPRALRDIFLLETSKHLGRRLKEAGKHRRIAFEGLGKIGLPVQRFTEADIRGWGITEQTTEKELIGILQVQIPEIPSFWMNDNSAELADSLVEHLKLNRTFWDCIVANLGWWAAITLGGGLIIFFILLGSGVPWPFALLIAGIYQTGATLYFLLQCAYNPEFQQR